ncbi:MAG: DNA methyltransferase [Thermoproteota archaeon]
MTEYQSSFPIEERYDLKLITTFILNKKYPIYNWFYFKEGFSRDFVEYAVNLLGYEPKVVLDPFVGAGTTLLYAREKGYYGIGVDASPLMVLISKVKTRDYDTKLLREEAQKLFKVKFRKPSLSNVSPFVKQFFNKYALEDIVFFNELVSNIEDEKVRNFFKVGLICTSSKVSYAYRDGSVLRVVKKNTPPFRKFFKRFVGKMIKDLEKVKFFAPEPEVRLGDARRLDFLEDSSVDAVITSPPYLNKIEYTKVYRIEYELFLKGEEPNLVRSFIGLSNVDEDFEPSMPPVAKAYFKDMRLVLKEVKRVLSEGKKAIFLLAGGVFPTGVVESDLELSKIAVEEGFKVERIVALNKRVATRNRVEKIGWARESAVVLKKE